VILRALDYFTGILFLTTNRVGQFEEAFLSRIHVSLGYEKLDDAAREQIWQNLFDKLGADHERGGPKIVYDYDAKCYAKSKDVQSLEWNGREIRNGKFARDTLRTNTPFTDNHKLSKPPLLSHFTTPNTRIAGHRRKSSNVTSSKWCQCRPPSASTW
jgi:hypothetical protein